MKQAKYLVPVLLLAVGCSGPDWEGEYAVTGTWNLAGPLADGRTVGHAISDLIVDFIAGSTPLPGDAEDAFAKLLDAQIRPFVEEVVDSEIPPELQQNGETMQVLRGSLALVRMQSHLEIEAGGDGVEGMETFSVLEVPIRGQTLTVTAAELSGAALESEWNGEEDDARFELEEHQVEIYYGKLVKMAIEQVHTDAEIDSLRDDVIAAVQCSSIVDRALDGRGSLEIDLGLTSVPVSRGALTSACTFARDSIGDRALGLFSLDSKVTVGGKVLASDADGDGVFEVQSEPGFGGVLNVAPKAIAPKVLVDFHGVKTE